MRFAMAFIALLAFSSSANAQTYDAKLGVTKGQPFSIEITLGCPPPDGTPPTGPCNGGTFVWFTISQTGTMPDQVWLRPNVPTIAGPFIFPTVGEGQLINVMGAGGESAPFLQRVSFDVREPAQQVKRK